jgi:hypothetical protein
LFLFANACRNNHDPDFARKITLDVYSGAVQQLRLAVYDTDSDDGSYLEKDLLGEAFTIVGKLESADGPLQFSLSKDGKDVKDAVIIVHPMEKAAEPEEASPSPAAVASEIPKEAEAAPTVWQFDLPITVSCRSVVRSCQSYLHVRLVDEFYHYVFMVRYSRDLPKSDFMSKSDPMVCLFGPSDKGENSLLSQTDAFKYVILLCACWTLDVCGADAVSVSFQKRAQPGL